MFSSFEDELRFRDAWESVEIVRSVPYSLFTFGHSDLPYYLVCKAETPGAMVSVRQGEVKIDRPLIITPDSGHPEFENFFEDAEEAAYGSGMIEFLLARTTAFSNLKLANRCGPVKLVSDSVEEIVAKLNQQLDHEEEDRVAVLTAPARLGGVAVFKYAAERVVSSAPDNVQELRERGLLP